MLCRTCGAAIRAGTRFCPNCGAPVAPGRTDCPYCGARLFMTEAAWLVTDWYEK